MSDVCDDDDPDLDNFWSVPFVKILALKKNRMNFLGTALVRDRWQWDSGGQGWTPTGVARRSKKWRRPAGKKEPRK